MRLLVWGLLLTACLGGCAAPRIFVPDLERSGFNNMSGMELESGDRVDVTLTDGSRLSGYYLGLDNGSLIIQRDGDLGETVRMTIPMADVETVVSSKASAKEGLVSVLFLIPVSLMISWLETLDVGLN